MPDLSGFAPHAPLPFYPGPVSLHPAVAAVLARDYGPPRTGDEYRALYASVSARLAVLLGTSCEVDIHTGEAMAVLWGALKSLLKPGDAMLAVGTGVFGDGFAAMAEAAGCRAVLVSEPHDATISASTLQRVQDAVRIHRPVLMTAVHCETPSGTLNPLEELGRLKRDMGVPLFVVDAVASVGGAPVRADAWNADCVLGGAQKCLSCPPDACFASVSPAARERVREVGYAGYDAFLPFDGAADDPALFPYTPNRWGVAALDASLRAMEEEGIGNVFARHERAAALCREGLRASGVELWPAPGAVPSPTCTAARIPAGRTWPEWREALAKRGLVVGGSLGPLAGRVFRLGHMGTQADPARVSAAAAAVAAVMK